MHMLVKMDGDSHIRSLPLSLLPSSTKQVLSDLMNSTKVIPTEGPTKLPRDWRGLASLANITAEVAASIQDYADKTAKVLELWARDNTITLGHLLDSLQKLDRFDVYDDVCLDIMKHPGKGDQRIANHFAVHNKDQEIIHITTEWDDSELLTYDDRPGYKHRYHAYVLYADEDQGFVDELVSYLATKGLEICTKDKLLPGHATQYGPVSKLISQRCLRIILVYSPEFLNSPANTFFRDYAQAISIQHRQNKTIPIMYRLCQLPPHLALYHMLRYNSGMYQFWDKLAQTINIARMPRITTTAATNGAIQSAHSAVNIVEMNSDNYLHAAEPRCLPSRSTSEEVLGAASSSPEGSISSDTASEKKSPETDGPPKRFGN